MKKFIITIAVTLTIAFLAGTAQATPYYENFGVYSEFTAAANDWVATSTYQQTSINIDRFMVIGTTATATGMTNNGAGIFNSIGADWDMGFLLDQDGYDEPNWNEIITEMASFGLTFVADFVYTDPNGGWGVYHAGSFLTDNPGSNAPLQMSKSVQDSFWTTDSPYLTICGFNPNIEGTYNLSVVGGFGTIVNNVMLGGVGIDVNTCQPVPEPATMLLLGTGLVGLAGMSRKKRK